MSDNHLKAQRRAALRAGLLPAVKPFNPDRKLRVPTEEEEGYALAAWLRDRPIKFLHVPNEGLRSPQSAQRLKRLGLSPGAPDYLIFTPPPLLVRSSGCAVELKRQSYSPSDVKPEQLAWLASLKALGWEAFVAGGAAEAIAKLQSLGY